MLIYDVRTPSPNNNPSATTHPLDKFRADLERAETTEDVWKATDNCCRAFGFSCPAYGFGITEPRTGKQGVVVHAGKRPSAGADGGIVWIIVGASGGHARYPALPPVESPRTERMDSIGEWAGT